MQELTTTTVDSTVDYQPNTVNIERALKLRIENNLSYQQIADILGVSKQAVHQRLQRFTKFIDQPDDLIAYRNNKSNLMEAAELQLLIDLLDDDKRKKASLNNVAYSLKELHGMIRTERGQLNEIIGYADMVKVNDKINSRLREFEEKHGITNDTDGISDGTYTEHGDG